MRPVARLLTLAALAAVLAAAPLRAALAPEQVIRDWYRLTLELVRHTPTYAPPVAARSFAYIGTAAWEAMAATDPALVSLAGQVNGLTALPAAPAGETDPGAVANAALAAVVAELFANTGPTGQRALQAMTRRLTEAAHDGLPPAVAAASQAHGQAIAAHVLAWAAEDGGAVVENLGFPASYTPRADPAAWVPTSTIPLQQAPLLPGWGANRTFRLADGAACPLPPPPPYSEAPGSAFRAEAEEVLAVWRGLTPEQEEIARFWSDDAMLSPTPPGHWISIALQVLEQGGADGARHAEVLAILGLALGDAFIACWHAKYEFDLVRPVTYIRRVLDPAFQTVLITPPFPEYPSGHSTQSGAAEVVLTHLFGEDFAFTDATHVDEGMPPRTFPSFRAAADEAGISRLYGGIHFRAAIERGLAQGRCVGAHFTGIVTRR